MAQARLKHSVALLTSFFKHFLYICVSVGEYTCRSIHIAVIAQLTGIGSSNRVGSRGTVEHIYLLSISCAHPSEKNKTAATSETVFTPIHCPTFQKGLGKLSPSPVCRLSWKPRGGAQQEKTWNRRQTGGP